MERQQPMMSAEEMLNAIMGVDDLPRAVVPTPEWALAGIPEVTIRAFSVEDFEAFEASQAMRVAAKASAELAKAGISEEEARAEAAKKVMSNLAGMRALVASLAVIHPATGERIFTADSVAELGRKNACVLTRIMARVLELSGLSDSSEGAESADPSPAAPSSDFSS
jgi:hypothetical protein